MPEETPSMQLDRDELREDRAIDPRQLDVEALRNVDIYTKWAERCVELKAQEEAAEFNVDVVYSRLYQKCMDHPEEFGVAKPTVDAVKAGVTLHADHQAAVTRLRKIRKQLALHRVALEAIDIRRSTLKSLIELHGRQYFAGPEVPRDLIGAWAKANAPGGHVADRQRARLRGAPKEE